MKVYIGPYKNWFGPYQLAEFLCFWAKKEKDEHGFERKPDWVNNFGEWLAHGNVEPDPAPGQSKKLFQTERPKTWIYKFLLWVDSKKKRTFHVVIDDYDTWNMDSTLSPIILPMLKQLKEKKHGSPIVDMEDVPEYLRCYTTEDYDDQQTFEFYKEHKIEEGKYDVHARWDWVMNEMIWAFEQLNDDSNEDQFHTGESDLRSEPCEWDENGKPKLYKMVEGPNHTAKYDLEAHQVHSKRIENGLRLFGKYYRNLWD